MPGRAEEPQQQASPAQPQAAPASNSSFLDAFTSRRSLRQLGIFFAGATFFTAAQLITRRAVIRRYKASIPPFYHPSHIPYGQVNGAMEALEAFNIATVNVFSVAIMFAGGTMWAADVSSLDDLKGRVRHRIGTGDARSSDEEIEEWIASILARKDMKEAVKAATGMDLKQVIDDAKAAEDKANDENAKR